LNLPKPFHLFLICGLFLGFFLGGCGGGQNSGLAPGQVLMPGDKAMDFSLQDSSGNFMKLSDVPANTYLILFFYRGAWCSACMNHLLDLKSANQKFLDAHAVLAAVSVDPVEDSAAFSAQWHIPFPLLSDSELKLIGAYGFVDKNGHAGKDISRVGVVIIDPQKIVRYRYLGKDAFDRPSNDAILYVIQQLQTGTADYLAEENPHPVSGFGAVSRDSSPFSYLSLSNQIQ
jgi:thioredoxin-dependent peroxiredoxin